MAGKNIKKAILCNITVLAFLSYNTDGFSQYMKNSLRTRNNIDNHFLGSQQISTSSQHRKNDKAAGSISLSLGSNTNEINPIKRGSTVALVTPFTTTGKIDFPSLRRLLQFHVASQTDGLCILGTTGEASLLTMDERKAVLTVAVEEVKGKIPILVGTGAIDPTQVKEMTMQAIDCGCDASLIVTPPYIKPPPRGIVDHFTTMADLGLPVVIYNVPGRTAVDIIPETIALCARENSNIVGVKEATGDVSRVETIRSLTGDLEKPLLLYSGDDATEAEFVLKGGDGCISVTANVAPIAMHEMMDAALRGDADEALRLNKMLDIVHQKIFCESNPIPAKWALKRMGMIENAVCRPPLMELDKDYHGILEEALKIAELL